MADNRANTMIREIARATTGLEMTMDSAVHNIARSLRNFERVFISVLNISTQTFLYFTSKN